LNADRPPGATSAGRRFPLYPWRYPSAAGVVAARSLIFMGVPVDEAIAAVRAARGSDAFFNEHFVPGSTWQPAGRAWRPGSRAHGDHRSGGAARRARPGPGRGRPDHPPAPRHPRRGGVGQDAGRDPPRRVRRGDRCRGTRGGSSSSRSPTRPPARWPSARSGSAFPGSRQALDRRPLAGRRPAGEERGAHAGERGPSGTRGRQHGMDLADQDVLSTSWRVAYPGGEGVASSCGTEGVTCSVTGGWSPAPTWRDGIAKYTW